MPASGRWKASGGPILLLKLPSVPGLAVGILDHAFCESLEILIQIGIVAGELRAQVFDADFLLNSFDREPAPLYGLLHLLDNPVEQA